MGIQYFFKKFPNYLVKYIIICFFGFLASLFLIYFFSCKYPTFPFFEKICNYKCHLFSYTNCPNGCMLKCVSSGCSTIIENNCTSPFGCNYTVCLADCNGYGSCYYKSD